jgi:hypothetical protein
VAVQRAGEHAVRALHQRWVAFRGGQSEAQSRLGARPGASDLGAAVTLAGSGLTRPCLLSRLPLPRADTGSPSSTSSACSLEDPCVLSPKRVPLRGVRYIAAGAAHTVAVTDDATYSWGAGEAGGRGSSGGVGCRRERRPKRR